MDPRLLSYYNHELQYMREIGGEFAEEFPKIAGRLGLDGFECADPYVERLLEGFAFLAARVQLKIDAEFPKFTQHLLEMVYPHYLCPTPSAAVVQIEPDLSDSGLAEGFVVPRATPLRGLVSPADEQVPCEYRTSHEVALWPIKIVEAEFFSRDLASLDLPDVAGVKSGLRLRLETTAGLTFDKIALDRLPIHLRGGSEIPVRIHEQLFSSPLGVIVRPSQPKPKWQQRITKDCIAPIGYDDESAMLPYGPRSFQGYRLLHEYFTLPQRYLFVELRNLSDAVRKCKGNCLDVIVLLGSSNVELENSVDKSNFSLFCTPAVNLFPKRADRIHLDTRQSEHHIVVDRTRPMDFEVYEVTQVTGYGTESETKTFLPFYSHNDLSNFREHGSYFTLSRRPRVLSSKQAQYGPRSSYTGSESFLTLVDSREAPYSHNLRQLAVNTLCTNRDLPLHLPIGKGTTDFLIELSGPIKSTRCVAGPTRPKPSPSFQAGETCWRLVNHLALNYLSITDTDERSGAATLRELLRLYCDDNDVTDLKQIEGVQSVASKQITRRLPVPGRITVGRGLEVSVTLDESAFEGTGAFLLGAVLDRFFAKYVSINSFTETVVKSTERGEVIRWPTRIGQRQTL